MKEQTRSTDFQEMESKMQEKDHANKCLKERIRLLQTRIVHGDNCNNTESFKHKEKRRQTWGGSARTKQENPFQICTNLSPIKEISPLKLYSRKMADVVDICRFC